MNLKIYVQDWGSQGVIFTIAKSKEEAIRILQQKGSYNSIREVQEFNIEDGLIFESEGP